MFFENYEVFICPKHFWKKFSWKVVNFSIMVSNRCSLQNFFRQRREIQRMSLTEQISETGIAIGHLYIVAFCSIDNSISNKVIYSMVTNFDFIS